MFGFAVDRQIFGQFGRVVERPGFRGFIDEEVERVVDGHVRDEVDLDLEFAHGFGKHEAGQPVAIGVLLVIHEMPARADLERMRYHAGAAVRCGPEADDLRAQRHRPVVLVMRQVIDACVDRHVCARSFGFGRGCVRADASACGSGLRLPIPITELMDVAIAAKQPFRLGVTLPRFSAMPRHGADWGLFSIRWAWAKSNLRRTPSGRMNG